MSAAAPEPTTGEQLLLDLAVDECPEPAQISIIDDETGALTIGAHRRFPAAQIRVHCDLLSAEARVRAALAAEESAAQDSTGEVSGAVTITEELASAVDERTELILFPLPKSLDGLDELARVVADRVGPGARLLGLGRVRHMNRSMNDVLTRSFGAVRGSRGRGKYRALIAGEPRSSRSGADPFPRQTRDAALDLIVVAHGAVFAGPKVDHGTRLLLDCRDAWPQSSQIVDLGCGTGILAAVAARRQPAASVLALDESAAACASARSTAETNGLTDRITVRRGDGVSDVPDTSVDLILCNPPFHVGTAKDSAPALSMFEDVARVLRPTGEMWTVFNTHLPYRQALRAAIGPTGIFRQDASYLVTRTRLR